MSVANKEVAQLCKFNILQKLPNAYHEYKNRFLDNNETSHMIEIADQKYNLLPLFSKT